MKFQFKLLASAIVEIEADTVEEAQLKMTHDWYHKGIKSKDAQFTVQHVINYDPNYPDNDFRHPAEHDQMARNAYHKAISPVSWAAIAIGVGTILFMAVFSSPAKANYCGPYDNWRPDCRQQRETTIYPTYPGSDARDWGKPGTVIERQGDDTTIYQTYPGSNARDFSKPAIKLDRNWQNEP